MPSIPESKPKPTRDVDRAVDAVLEIAHCITHPCDTTTELRGRDLVTALKDAYKRLQAVEAARPACWYCDGAGEVERSLPGSNPWDTTTETCPICRDGIDPVQHVPVTSNRGLRVF